jgi:hypothetical protein
MKGDNLLHLPGWPREVVVDDDDFIRMVGVGLRLKRGEAMAQALGIIPHRHYHRHKERDSVVRNEATVNLPL